MHPRRPARPIDETPQHAAHALRPPNRPQTVRSHHTSLGRPGSPFSPPLVTRGRYEYRGSLQIQIDISDDQIFFGWPLHALVGGAAPLYRGMVLQVTADHPGRSSS